MITTSDAAVRTALKEIVSERPAYVYAAPEYMKDAEDINLPLCFYVHNDADGNPESAGCGVGAVLHRLGVPLEELRKYEGRTARQMLKEVISGIDRGTAVVLETFQGEQDEKTPWGEAYEAATGETI
ncbi:hypothetical protein ACIBAH_35065 [Streptomyces sp. NPDC051445]|uniref:hypothetical protein n=1 Tax=Streptomyces sp. NPDC051445 TaxID=3365653 RepID=UPI003797034C